IKSVSYPFSIVKAKAEMAKSKHANGFSTTMPCLSFQVQECQVTSGQLAKIGLKVAVKEVSIALATALEFKATIQPGYIPCSPDPNGCPTFILGSTAPYNTALYKPPAMDKLLNAGVATLIPAKRFASYSPILKMLATDVPYVANTIPVYTIALSKKFIWPGIATAPGETIFYTPWILNIHPA